MEKEAAAIDTRDPLDNLVFKSSTTRSDMLFITLINSMFNSLKFIELRCFQDLLSIIYSPKVQQYFETCKKMGRKVSEIVYRGSFFSFLWPFKNKKKQDNHLVKKKERKCAFLSATPSLPTFMDGQVIS